MDYVTEGWKRIKDSIDGIEDIYTFDETINLLTTTYYYKDYFGRAKNRTMIKSNPKLYKSIYEHTQILEDTFIAENKYKGWYNFKYRMIFLVENNGDIDTLKCQCGKSHNWNKYCRYCPEPKKTWLGKKHTKSSKKKQRISTLKYIESMNGQLAPRYNINSIPIIEQYGKEHGYNFQHAENGGEYHIKELGYFIDGYDKKNNVVIEIDEPHHFDSNGELRENDKIRQREITKYLGCKFIRIKYER